MSNKIQYQIEYTINTSPKVLFYRLSSPSGLSEWFADDVNIKGGNYTFIWEGNGEVAEVLSKKENSHIKFRWLEEDDEKAFFEFRIGVDELTNDVALHITDYVEEEEKQDAIELWDTQISALKHSLGV
jgi:uncharacterized protein YndB with AHSA1/START domain